MHKQYALIKHAISVVSYAATGQCSDCHMMISDVICQLFASDAEIQMTPNTLL